MATPHPKKPKETDPLFWGNIWLLVGCLIAVPLSYAFQPGLVKQSEGLQRYSAQTLLALPNLFGDWPQGQGLVLRTTNGQTIRIEDVDSTTAADLGITLVAASGSGGAGVPPANAPTPGSKPTRAPEPARGFELYPHLSPQDLLADLGGAMGKGIRLGSVKVIVDGREKDVDLAGAVTAGDVAERLNRVIAQLDSAAGSVSVNNRGTVDGFLVSAAAGHTVQIANARSIARGKPLGLAEPPATQPAAPNAPAPTTDTRPLTIATPLSSLRSPTGAPINTTNLKIKLTVDGNISDVDLRRAATLGDLMNLVNKAIKNSKGDGSLSTDGARLVLTCAANHFLRIGNAGKEGKDSATADELGLALYANGIAAADLGLIVTARGQSEAGVGLAPIVTARTRLDDLRGARRSGVAPGSLRVTVNGQANTVDLRGAGTLGDVVARVNRVMPGADRQASGLAIGAGQAVMAAGAGGPVRWTLGLAAGLGLALGLGGTMYRSRRRLADPGAVLAAAPEDRKVGTLSYTKAALIILFCWLMWGDFCYVLMERIYPTIMPLQLQALGASSGQMNFLMVSMPAILGFGVAPVVAYKSDRYRGRWGRRIPFLVATAPFLCLFLGALGYSAEIGTFLHGSDLPAHLHLSPETATLIVVGVLIVGFQFFNIFVQSMTGYLVMDVVPRAFMARYFGIINVVSGITVFFYSTFIYGKAEDPAQQGRIYWGAALLYLVGYGLVCWGVKEGQYPPVTDAGPRQSRWEPARIYFRECFTHPLFLCLFLFNAMWALTNAVNNFRIFFLRDHVGLSLTQMGLIGGLTTMVTTSLYYVLGWVIDKVGALRTMLLSIIILIPVHYAGAAVNDYYSYLLVAVFISLSTQLFDASYPPMMMTLLPRERFGQFMSANGLMRSAMNMGAPLVGAWFIDAMTRHGTYLINYRYTFIWQASFMLLALANFLFVYFYWKKHGGHRGYVPPDTTVKAVENGTQ